MFLFPPSKWVGGIFYEHTHRLMGTVVGMLSIALVVVAWKTEQRRWVRWLAVSVLVAVILQGILGGLRVTKVNLTLAIIHACFAQAFFCFAAFMAIVTSKWWISAPDLSARPARGLLFATTACVLAIYFQLIAGALMRHHGAGLAIPDLPLAYGKLLPPTDQTALDKANAFRAWESGLGPVSLYQVWLHFGHRLGSVIVSALSMAAIAVVIRRYRGQKALLRPAVLLAVLIVAQVTLGVFTVLYRKPADVASAHVAVGALVLLTSFVIVVRAARLFARRATTPAFEPVPARETSGAGTLAVG
jgi:cytochrome c oxidase assembly protein subunit 15